MAVKVAVCTICAIAIYCLTLYGHVQKTEYAHQAKQSKQSQSQRTGTLHQTKSGEIIIIADKKK